jgi:hypothetical protein
LYEAGVLILDFPNIPPHLRDYVREAKHCYASGQELAMCILCRAILETSLNDLAYREWGRLGVEIKPDRSEVAQTSIRELINGLLKRDPVLKRRAHKVVDVCNRCVHPAAWAEPVVPVDPREFLQETLSVVQEIYKHTDFPR